MRSGCTVIAVMSASLTACSPVANYAPYREKVKSELRDPASAEFRSESVRTLWTSDGKRIQLYCAEVNANNAFGGMSGFLPARVIIASKGLGPNPLYATGEVWVDGEMNEGYYLDCVRKDTQREIENFGKAYFSVGDFDQEEADRVEPVLSNDLAPEER